MSFGTMPDLEIPFKGLTRSDARQICILSTTLVFCCLARAMVWAKSFVSPELGWVVGDGNGEAERFKDFAGAR